MFSLRVEKDVCGEDVYHIVTLELKYEGLTLFFEPEFPEKIKDIDIQADSGCIDTNPSNGEFSLNWSPESITLSCGRHGDGFGGSMVTRLETTPQLMESLQSSLQLWKDTILSKTC